MGVKTTPETIIFEMMISVLKLHTTGMIVRIERVWFGSIYCGVGSFEMRVTHSAMSTLSDSTSFIHGWAWKKGLKGQYKNIHQTLLGLQNTGDSLYLTYGCNHCCKPLNKATKNRLFKKMKIVSIQTKISLMMARSVLKYFFHKEISCSWKQFIDIFKSDHKLRIGLLSIERIAANNSFPTLS